MTNTGPSSVRRLVADPRALPVGSVGLAVAALVEVVAETSKANQPYLLVLLLLALATTLPPAFLGPIPAAIAVGAADVLSLAPFHVLTVAGACMQLVVLFRLTGAGSQLMAAALVVPYPILAVAGPAGSRMPAIALTALAPTAAWAGAALRARREADEHSAARELIDGTLVAHTARGERARIARELHDVVAHHISMVAVQAETARLTTPGLPAAGAQRLSAIADTARAALTEMRLLLGVLREDAQHETPDLQPQPGLRQLNELLDEARAATGAGARLILHGPPELLDPGVELAVYRIVQEALTNARRHAPGAAVDVELCYTGDTVRLRVRDNGPGPNPIALDGGLGLLGMRERAAAVGGLLRSGPVVGGGFLVEATLPAKTDVSG